MKDTKSNHLEERLNCEIKMTQNDIDRYVVAMKDADNHERADYILKNFVKDCGYKELVDAYENIPRFFEQSRYMLTKIQAGVLVDLVREYFLKNCMYSYYDALSTYKYERDVEYDDVFGTEIITFNHNKEKYEYILILSPFGIKVIPADTGREMFYVINFGEIFGNDLANEFNIPMWDKPVEYLRSLLGKDE